MRLQTPPGWVTLRYGMDSFARREAVLYFEGGCWRLDPQGMALRWPDA